MERTTGIVNMSSISTEIINNEFQKRIFDNISKIQKLIIDEALDLGYDPNNCFSFINSERYGVKHLYSGRQQLRLSKKRKEEALTYTKRIDRTKDKIHLISGYLAKINNKAKVFADILNAIPEYFHHYFLPYQPEDYINNGIVVDIKDDKYFDLMNGLRVYRMLRKE